MSRERVAKWRRCDASLSRSRYRLRYFVSWSWRPWNFSGGECSDLTSSVIVSTSTLGSPRRVRVSGPVMPTMSPRSSMLTGACAPPGRSARNHICMRPDSSSMCANAAPPRSRSCMILPATETTGRSAASTSASGCSVSYAASRRRASSMVALGAKSTPYDAIPRARSSSTLRRRSAKRSSDGMRAIFPGETRFVRVTRAAKCLVDLDDLDLPCAAGALHVDGVTDLVAEQRFADRRLHRDPAGRHIDLSGSDNRVGLFAEIVLDVDGRADADDPCLTSLFDDHMVADHVLDDEDASFEHALLVFCFVVFGVLRDITEVLGVLDALGHLGATHRPQLFQLALQLDETVLREQHRLVHSVPCHSKVYEMPSDIRSLEPGV